MQLLIDAFPLQDPAAAEETDELLTRQFTLIGVALGDGVPAVRATAVLGVCRLLNVFWELVPAPTIAGFLKRLAGRIFLRSTAPGWSFRVLVCSCFQINVPVRVPACFKSFSKWLRRSKGFWRKTPCA